MEREKEARLRSPEETLLSGDYTIEGDFELHVLSNAVHGRILRQEYALSGPQGEARYLSMGTDQFMANWGTYRLRKGLAVSSEIDEPIIELHVQLDGFVQIAEAPSGLDVRMRAGDSNLAFMPTTRGSFAIGEDVAGTVFEVQFAVGYFRGLAERHPEVLEPFLRGMARAEPCWLSRRPIRTTAAMQSVIAGIRQGAGDASAAGLLLEAQVLSLLALQADERATAPPRRDDALPRADVDLMYEARAILLGRMTAPPTLAELARCVGTNEFKLKQGFRAVFGTSPYALLLEHKLEHARTLLLDTDQTIAEIAYAVGYSHPSHFTHAFRKQYGVPPSALR